MTDNNHLSIAPAVEAGPVPEGFQIDIVQRLLNGSTEPMDLNDAFRWEAIHQGYQYWANQWERLDSDLPITEDAAAILREWIKQTEARS
jgi:hypothetical protein